MMPIVERPDFKSDVVLSSQQLKSRRARNIAIGVAVGLLCLLFYVVTIAKLGVAVLNRPL
jgi:hypothetical protein